MSKIAFYFLHGIEVRHFILSGLLKKISEENEVIFITEKKIESSIFDEYLQTYKVKFLVLPPTEIKKTGTKIEAGIRAIRDARKRRKQLGIYSHFKKAKERHQFADFIKGNIVSHYFSDILGRKLLTRQRNSQTLFDFVKEQKFKKMFVVDYGTPISKVFLQVCHTQHVEINVFTNSLKSVFIDDFIPFPLHKFNTWNETQRSLFANANPGINNTTIVATGLPYHNFLRQQDLEKNKAVQKKYNLSTTRPIVVYSMIFEKVFNLEHLIIEQINNYFINEFDLSSRPVIVLRRNPFEEDMQGINYLSSLENIIIASHNWERDESKAWTIQSLEGELEWKALLQLSTVSMNMPSMSTIDSLMCGTPVVNIAFDESGMENLRIPHIIHAPFVEEFEKSKFVKTFTSFESFKISFPKLLALKTHAAIEEIQNSIDIVQSDINKFT